MPCKLDLTGADPTCRANTQVTIKLVAAKHILQNVSLNATDLTPNINAADKSVSFPVPAGRNTVTLVLFPPPAPEPIEVDEDCGGGVTQPIASFGVDLRAAISFTIVGN